MGRRGALRDRDMFLFRFGPELNLLRDGPASLLVPPKPTTDGDWLDDERGAMASVPVPAAAPSVRAAPPPPEVPPEPPPVEQEVSSPRLGARDSVVFGGSGPRRIRRVRVPVAATVVAVLLAGAGFFALRDGPGPPRQGDAGAGATPSYVSLAWAVRDGSDSYIAAIGVPVGKPPAVLTIPADTLVDGPAGGPRTVGEATADPAELLAATQATLERHIQRAVVTETFDFTLLVDTLGGIEVEVDEPFVGPAGIIEPGVQELIGGDVLAYLRASTGDEREIRWAEVLTRLLETTGDAQAWADAVGDPGPVVAARTAQIVELPTVVDDDGNLRPDAGAVEEIVGDIFGADGTLVRVVVLNGVGRPGVGAELATRLAPSGYRVVASQNATEFVQVETEIVAASDSLIPHAEDVQAILGAGTVYVGRQATGVADIMIVVGSDLAGE